MIAGRSYHGLRVDLWSAGVILFALLCGYLPFDESDTQVLYRKIMQGDFSIPSFVSNAATDLIKRILTTDPEKRFTLEQIKAHQWFHLYKGYVNLPKGLIIDYHEIPVDEAVIENVIQYGYERELIVQSIVNNRQNVISTLYYLILRKMIRKEGHVSAADMNSMFFKPKLLVKAAAKKLEEPSVVTKDTRSASPDMNMQAVMKIHENITSKAKQSNAQVLNVTRLAPYEENLLNNQNKKIVKQKPEGRDDKRKGNRTQTVIKQPTKTVGDKITSSKVEADKKDGLKDTRDFRTNSTNPPSSQVKKVNESGVRKNILPIKTSRSPTPDSSSHNRNVRDGPLSKSQVPSTASKAIGNLANSYALVSKYPSNKYPQPAP